MGKKNNTKKPKFRALNPLELEKEDKKAAAVTSRTAVVETRKEAPEDIPLPCGPPPPPSPVVQVEPSSANCDLEKVQNGEDDGRAAAQFDFEAPKTPPSAKSKDDYSRSHAGSRYNESRSRRSGPRPHSKERPKDTAPAISKTCGITIWDQRQAAIKKSQLNINAKAFEPRLAPSSSGRTEPWDSTSDDNTKLPAQPVKNFSHVVSQPPKAPWADALTKEEKQSQVESKEPIDEITNQWPTATNLDPDWDKEPDNEQNEQPLNHNERKDSASQNDGDKSWRTEPRRKLGEAHGFDGSRRRYDKRSGSPRRSSDHKRSSPRRDSDRKKSSEYRSSPHTGSDHRRASSPQRSSDYKRRSSPHRNSDYRRSSPHRGYDKRESSSPQRSFDNRKSSPHRNSFGGGRGGEGSFPSWGERGSSSERDGDYKEFCSLARSKDRPEYIKVKEIDGDLFAQPKEYSLGHCVAEDMGMGSGIAVQFRRDFKHVDELLNQRQKQGGLAVLEDGDRRIYYLVTKRVSSGKPTYHTLFCSLRKMRQHMLDNSITKLALPRIGCGLDRLEWSHVKHMVEYVFRDDDVEIVVCNFQQDENLPPAKAKRGRLVKQEKPIQDIENGTIIIYTTSTEADDISPEMQELDKKFPMLLVPLRNSPRILGKTIVYDKNADYRLYGCVVKRKKSDQFDYVEFQKCVSAIDKENKKLEFWYVAFQTVTDPEDDLINEKVVNIVRNTVRNVDVYVCGCLEKPSAF